MFWVLRFTLPRAFRCHFGCSLSLSLAGSFRWRKLQKTFPRCSTFVADCRLGTFRGTSRGGDFCGPHFELLFGIGRRLCAFGENFTSKTLRGCHQSKTTLRFGAEGLFQQCSQGWQATLRRSIDFSTRMTLWRFCHRADKGSNFGGLGRLLSRSHLAMPTLCLCCSRNFSLEGMTLARGRHLS